ncbi:Glucan-binding domain-containing protein (YG repeat) [Ruminococcaceae bacterium YRB3002]|nr:Glucan-binding domain-containing protein (YG repeat) [Ruminococcaceae bacterium YRB3002]
MMRKLRSLFIVVLVVALFSNTVSASTIKSFSMTYTVDQQEARDMLPLINEWRQSGDAWYWKSDDTTKYMCGKLSTYTYDYNLEQIALQRAYEVAVSFSHTRTDGSDCFTCTYNGTRSWGENIAAGYSTAAATFEQWQENDDMYAGQGHRRAMLSTRYTAIGIGHVVYNGYHYWVQEFGEANSGAAATTAITGTRTGTIRMDVDSATFKLSTDSRISSIAYGTSKDLPQIIGRYSTSSTWGSGGAVVPGSDLTNVKWTSSDTSKLVIQNNTTVKAVGAGSCTLTYSATYGGKSYSGTMNVSVSSVSIGGSDVTATIDTCSYEVNGVSPKPVIKYNGQTLVEGTDYEIQRYGNATYVTNQAFAYVKGLGNFSGTKYIYFEIVKSQLSDCTLSAIPDASYTGNAITPAVTLTYKGAELRKGTHYTVSCTDNTAVGTATVTITGLTGFEGTLTSTFKIVTQTAANLTVDTIADQQYSGSEITPGINIKNGTRYLANGTDYDVVFSNNIEPGTASAKITFKGNYTGTKTVSFKIVPRQMTNVYVSGYYNKTYTGSPISQTALTLTCGSYTLVEGTDYTVAYSDNTYVGTATITLTGKGSHFTGTRSITFNINPVSASQTTFTLNGTCTYTGSAVIPDFTLKYGDLKFVEGTDFTVEYSDNVEPGQAKAVITGISSILSGTANKYFTISRKSIAALTFTDIPDQVYTGSAITPAIVIKDGNKTLVEGTDYSVTYYRNTSVGNNAYAVIIGTGRYCNSKTIYFSIVGRSIADATINAIPAQTYTGSAIKPAVTVKYNGNTLTSGTDYTVSYADNVNVGTATVTVTGRGTYAGTKTATFSIVANTSSLTISSIAAQTFTGSAIKPAVTVKCGTKTLTSGTDYTVAYYDNTDAGTATVTVTGKGNYSGTATATFTINAKPISGVTLSSVADQTYSGSAITPAVTVKDGSKTLTKGTDYTVSYSGNTNAGTATVTVTGKGNYTGTKSTTFAISAKTISGVTIAAISAQAYTGSAITPVITVKDGSKTLAKGTDYTVAYSNNVNVGTATVTITGKGNYTGTKSGTFTIVANTTGLTISPISDQTYTGYAVKPAVTVKSGSKTLVKDTDYTVAYSNNVYVGTATVTVTGKGSYSGTATANFYIVAKSVSGLTLSQVDSLTYTGSEITPFVSVKDGNITIQSGKDYEVSYTNNINVGTATLTVTGIGNYTGTKSVDFQILAKTLTGVTISPIADQTYTGSAIKPAVTVKDGSRLLVKGTDYSVSYSNNVNVGTATVTVTGKGNYTGTRTVYFSIVTVASGFTVSPIDDQTYTGSAIKPVVTVKDGSKTLVNGTDYTVSYSNNVNAGTATVTVTGKGNYSGSESVTFVIAAKSISGATISSIADQKYTGSAIKPAVTVKDGSVTLVKDTDYTVSYSNNVNVGTATVTVKGKGNYSGTKYATFKIVPASNPDPDSEVLTYTWKQVSGKWYLYDNYGRKVTGFAKVKDTWYYMNASGVMMTGWQKVDGVWYYFASSGAMKTGWQQISKVWYYFDAEGKMLTGFQEIGGVWYYFASSGAMKTGWQQVDGVWYYFASSGAMKTGWQQISKVWYYFDAEGKMLTGFQEIGGSMYYLKSSGAMATKWLKIDGDWYWFGTSGAMARSTSVKIDGKTYKFDADGVCLNP